MAAPLRTGPLGAPDAPGATDGATVLPAAEDDGPALTIERQFSSAYWPSIVGVGVLLAAGGLWVRSVVATDPQAMTELGLISVLPISFFVAVALLTVGFVVFSSQPARYRSLVAAYFATFVVAIHATPIVVSGVLGNAWAWANVGVVDHVQRTGELPAVTDPLAAPTDWPGVSGFTALLAEASGVDAATIAMWAPLGFTLVALLALWVLLRSITSDERLVWSAMWLFVVGNWVGQEHLSPQGLGFALGLALLAVALPVDRTDGSDPVIPNNIGPAGESVPALAGVVAFSFLVGAAIVTSDQLTPIVLAVTFVVAFATRASRTLWLAIALGAATILWFVGPAWGYVSSGGPGFLAPTGSPAQFATMAASGLSTLTPGAQTVVIAGRFVAQVLVVLAIVGLAARWLGRQRVGFLAGAVAAPLVVIIGGADSESLLRAFLFALPWLALAGASAFALSARRLGPGADLAVRLAVIGALTVGFVVAMSGERGAGHFTSSEVDVVASLAETAPARTLLIEGSANGPGVGRDVDRFTFAPLTEESPETIVELQADPEGVLHDRMVAARAAGFAAVYVVLTRSQVRGEAIAPRLPERLIETIDGSLRVSPRFMIVAENADAIVYSLAERAS